MSKDQTPKKESHCVHCQQPNPPKKAIISYKFVSELCDACFALYFGMIKFPPTPEDFDKMARFLNYEDWATLEKTAPITFHSRR
jgi:hypothetical protein